MYSEIAIESPEAPVYNIHVHYEFEGKQQLIRFYGHHSLLLIMSLHIHIVYHDFNNIHTIQRKEMIKNLPLKMKFQQSTNFLMYQIILVAGMIMNNRRSYKVAELTY